MDIRTKLILALVSTSLLSMAAFGLATYQLSAVLIAQNASQQLLDQLLTRLIDTGLAVAAFAILGGVVLGIFGARQIRKLANTVDRIRHGELDLRAEIVGEDEVALLARSLNEFMDQLNRSSDIFQLGQLRVLVAENHATNRHLLNELLTNWRMQAVLVDDGASAMRAIESAAQHMEPIQLIVLDGEMPEMQGFEFLQKLGSFEDWERCPIILLAKDPNSLDAHKLKEMGVSHVLPAPVIASDLMEAILEEMGVSASAMENMPDVFLTRTTPREILLVEDSNIIQKVTSGFLRNWGHDVTLATDGQSAVELAMSRQFDLIFMDLEMPNMGGIDATLAIRNAEPDDQPRTPIVALTAKATKRAREECMAAGMNEYISKPVDPKVLYRLVNSYPVRPAAANAADPPPDVGPATHVAPADTAQGNAIVIDWEAARSLTGGDEDLLAELVELFPVESNKHLEDIAQAIADDDAEKATRAAHTLKSAARFFGAAAVVEVAAEIEDLGRQSDLAQAQQRLPQLEAQTALLVAELVAAQA